MVLCNPLTCPYFLPDLPHQQSLGASELAPSQVHTLLLVICVFGLVCSAHVGWFVGLVDSFGVKLPKHENTESVFEFLSYYGSNLEFVQTTKYEYLY